MEGTTSHQLIRRLTGDDFKIVSRFIDRESKSIPTELFFPPNEAIISKSLDIKTGISHGYFDHNNLVGVRLTYMPGLDKENHGYDLGYSDEELYSTAQFHGTLVLKEKRYKGLGNRLVEINCDAIFNENFLRILATVHPSNSTSINMLLLNGFERKIEVLKYRNLPRLIFERKKGH